jgi:DNA repair photolyase
LYGQADRFGATLTFTNDIDSRAWEPGAALPEDRIEALRLAHDRGIHTWTSMEPVIDPAQTLHLIDATHEFIDLFRVGKLNHHPKIEATIDWPKFRSEVEVLLQRLNKAYMLKHQLREF